LIRGLDEKHGMPTMAKVILCVRCKQKYYFSVAKDRILQICQDRS
jgi:hypothetical protein